MTLHKAGHRGEALDVATKAATLTPSGIGAFSLAGYWAIVGDRARTIQYLRQATKLGWTAELRNDPDFAPLKGDPEFEAIAAENDRRLHAPAASPTP